MTGERWEQVKELLHRAMQLGAEQRSRFLGDACSSDVALRAEVESLLSADADARSSFLQSAPHAGALDLDSDGLGAVGDLAPGQLFEHRFQLVRKLGEGGMGQVWLAEQTTPVRRSVALKLIRAGMYDETVVHRFKSERQSLAIMDHPAIAKVFDAGATPKGQPYLVMEYAPGLPITEYCDQRKLRIRDRLELFIQACEGVQHAHQKAIIHRDLKPANILVVDVDGKPVPRIIDFGLAKAAVPELTGQTLFTRFGQFMGTPGYMSPEQVDPNIRDIDTRTDVYSLGVILYVLLTGLQPFEAKGRQRPSLEEWLRQLREDEPPHPSRKIAADRETMSSGAAARGTEPKQWVRQLLGDLDCIAMKALERDRARRYGTPSELAADLRRYLNHEPVLARPAGAGYRLRKYTRRHRVAVAVGAGLLVVFAVFSVLQALQLQQISEERDRANRERDRATRITDFMTGMFKVADPSESRGYNITVREILDKASGDIQTGLNADPLLQAQLMSIMGQVYDHLGLYSRAQPLLAKAVDIRRQVLGPESPETLDATIPLARALRDTGKNAEAEKLLRSTLEVQRRNLAGDDAATSRTMSQLAWTLAAESRYPEAEKLEREALAWQRRVLGADDPQTLNTMNRLASIVRHEGQFAAAQELDRETLEKRRRILGPDNDETLDSMTQLANDFSVQGDYTEAEKLDRENLQIRRRIYGPEHPKTLGMSRNLSDDLASEGLYAEAQKLGEEEFDIERRVLGPENPQTADAADNLAAIHRIQGHLAAAEFLDRQALKIRQGLLGPEHSETLHSMIGLANDMDLRGSYLEAEKLAEDAFDTARRVLGQENPSTLQAMQQLATTAAHLRRYAEAETLDRTVMRLARHAPGADSPIAASAEYHLAGLTARRGAHDESISLIRESLNGLDVNTLRGVATDSALKSLHGDPRFESLIADANSRVDPISRNRIPGTTTP